MSENQYNEKEIQKRTTSGILSLSLRYLVTYGFQLISTTTLARFLTSADYGVYGIIQNWIGSLSYATDIGLKESLIQQQQKVTEDQLKSYIAIRGSLAITTSILFAISFYFFNTKLKVTSESFVLIYALGIINLLDILVSVPIIKLQKDLNFKKQARIEILSGAFLYMVQIGMAIIGFGFWSLFAGAIAKHFIIILYGLSKNFYVFPSFSKLYKIKHLFRLGVFFQLALLVFALKGILEPVLLKYFIPIEELGLFYWGFGLISAPLGIVFSSFQVLFPTISMIQSDSDHVRRLSSRGFELITLAIVLIFSIGAVSSPFLIELLFTKNWYSAKPLMAPICLVVSFFALRQIPIVILTGMGMPKEKFINEVIFFISFFTFSLILIEDYGVRGHIFATFVGHLLSMIYLIIKTKKFLFKRSLYKAFVLYLGSTLSVIMTYTLTVVEEIWISLPLFTIITLIIYGLFDRTIFSDFGFLIGSLKRKKVN